jgi:hypothetical protein
MPARALQPWEQRLLRLVSEQGAIPLDQLALHRWRGSAGRTDGVAPGG